MARRFGAVLAGWLVVALAGCSGGGGADEAQDRVASPVMSAGGVFDEPQTVELATATPGATIYYATGAEDPTEITGTPYTGPLRVEENTTLRAIACKAGLLPSAVTTGDFRIRCGPPALEPPTGDFDAPRAVTLASTTPGAVIRYTLDGTPPSSRAGETYEGPVLLTHDATLRALASKPGMEDSRESVGEYRVAIVPPAFDPPGGPYSEAQAVALASATPGALVYYTWDGSTPSPAAGILYTGPVAVTGTATLAAVAVHAGFTSEIASQSYVLVPGAATGPVDAVTASGATVRGAVNPNGEAAEAWFEWGTDPGLASPQRTAPVALGGGTVPVPVTAELGGLASGVTYYYRVVAQSGSGTSRGEVDYLAPEPADPADIVVNCPDDVESPPPGKMTLRAALARLDPGGRITFDPALDGQTIPLRIVGDPHSVLKGEVFAMVRGRWEFRGYQERDYGRSALYAAKDLTIDASALPRGVTLRWAGGDGVRARVLAVYGDLVLRNVALLSGFAESEPLADPAQPHTLARGGGLAVWGTATLESCTVGGNRASGDPEPSRDRGAFGGGIYGNVLILRDCVVSGNAVSGFGAAGGGVYSVGGAEDGDDTSRLERCSVAGNRVTGQHAYGGGVYSDGGGPGRINRFDLVGTTVARNRVEDHPDLSESPMFQYYYRGGGVYMSNGWIWVEGCTIAENQVSGPEATFGGKSNLGGGGVGATVGNAHVVETIEVLHSILAGNTVNATPSDLFTGSLIDFYSYGHNRIGKVDFSGILAPIPWWLCLSRRHYPKAGDLDGVSAAQVLDLAEARRHESLLSVGADPGEKVVLWYPPVGSAVDAIREQGEAVDFVWAEYSVAEGGTDDFLNHLLAKLRSEHGDVLGSDFGAHYGDLTGVTFHGPAETWPSDPANAPWIAFWSELFAELGDRLGPAGLGDEFWGSFGSGPLGENVVMEVMPILAGPFPPGPVDQLGNPRVAGAAADVGAVERPRP